MRVWLTCFFLLFCAVELLQWIQHVLLPLPFYGLGGLLLAIASNSGKQTGLPIQFRFSSDDTTKSD